MDKMLKVGQQSLMGYLPAIVIKNILDGEIDPSKKLPAYHTMNTVSLFADISGFTKLSEEFAKKGRIGPEFLAFSLNRYMEQLINIIGKNGGDIFKFAGDALLVVWPETKNNMEETCRRAIQCAMDIQSKLNKVEMSPGKPLSVKIGIGVGECRVLFVGGQFKRCEYLIIGEAMRQACESETNATEGGQIICSHPVYELVRKYYTFEEAHGDGSHGPSESEMKFYRIIKLVGDRVPIKADSYLMRTHFSSEKLREKLPLLKTFVPAAISIYLDIEKENWSKEIRMLTVMFLNLKVDLSQTKNEEGMARIQEISHVVQRCVYRTKGSLNKFLMDDKGSVMLVCWGLPPLSAPDDHVRSVLTALELAKELKQYNCGAYIGIATGTCFTGVCGTIGGRREYSLLGEMVNLSARHMQKAIYHAKDIAKETKGKCDYMILVCEKTRDLIQNKISCDYSCQGELKGFTNLFYFYEPREEIKPKFESHSFFLPSIKTHKNNILVGNPNPNEKSTPDNMLKSALYMVGRRDSIEECLNSLYRVYKKKEREFILIRGITGSGKSLFLRKVMFEFVDVNKELKNKLNNKYPFIFISYQLPTTLYNPMNGWTKILKEIYQYIVQTISGTKQAKLKFAGETFTIPCDIIGEMLLNSDCISLVRYIEEILGANFSKHYQLPDNSDFGKFFKIKEIPKRDTYFESRKFEKHEKNICKFFTLLIKYYRDNLIPEFPLIFVLEDCHLIDEISIELIRSLTINSESVMKGVCVLSSYQDEINSIVKNPFDRLCKTNDLFLTGNTFLMDNITDFNLAHDLIKHNIQNKVNVTHISEKLIHIILTKSMKGNPLFMIDIINSLIDGGYVRHPNQELLPSEELLEMYELNDWSKFTIPLRMEKILGNLVDNLSPKEIILLKYASVIGNIFDIDKLNDLNPFNSITFDDLNNILSNLEYHGIIEILYDLNPKHLVCKFNIPFFREVLFQRMLIEQRSDIHLNIARKMQANKFSYMPHKQEVAMLRHHLKTTEKTILKHMEEKDDTDRENGDSSGSSLNINNIKIILVKDICERLKLIDLRMESEEIELSKRSLPSIKAGYLSKKSDKYITWEVRYAVLTNTKFFYWYHEDEYKGNKMSLGSFELKHLYNVEILRDKEKGDKNNIFHMQVSLFYKKDKIKGAREFYFSCPSRDELYNWVITLNFLRVKAMYDEFSYNFGLINLPLSHEIRSKNKKKLKTKFQRNANRSTNRMAASSTIYTAIARKSIMTNKSGEGSINSKMNINDLNSRDNSQLVRRLSYNTPSQTDLNFDDNDNQEKLGKMKDLVMFCFEYGFSSLLGFMQDIVFGIDNIGMNDDRMISIPSHLSKFKNLPVTKTSLKNEKEITLKVNTSRKNSNNLFNSNIEERDDEDESGSESSENTSRKFKSQKTLQKIDDTSKGISITPNPKEGNISFQPIDESHISEVTNKSFGKQFTLQGVSLNANFKNKSYEQGKKEYENELHEKLKNLGMGDDDHLDEMINSISQQQSSRLSDDNGDYKKSKNNSDKNLILEEVKNKPTHDKNVNSTIFKKK